MVGGVISVYSNGTLLVTYTDPSPLGAGTIGVTANAGITYFDNVPATVLPRGGML